MAIILLFAYNGFVSRFVKFPGFYHELFLQMIANLERLEKQPGLFVHSHHPLH